MHGPCFPMHTPMLLHCAAAEATPKRAYSLRRGVASTARTADVVRVSGRLDLPTSECSWGVIMTRHQPQLARTVQRFEHHTAPKRTSARTAPIYMLLLAGLGIRTSGITGRIRHTYGYTCTAGACLACVYVPQAHSSSSRVSLAL